MARPSDWSSHCSSLSFRLLRTCHRGSDLRARRPFRPAGFFTRLQSAQKCLASAFFSHALAQQPGDCEHQKQPPIHFNIDRRKLKQNVSYATRWHSCPLDAIRNARRIRIALRLAARFRQSIHRRPSGSRRSFPISAARGKTVSADAFVFVNRRRHGHTTSLPTTALTNPAMICATSSGASRGDKCPVAGMTCMTA